MIKDIIINTIIGIVSGLLIFVGLVIIGYLLFKLLIIPYLLDKMPDLLKELLR